MAFLTVAEFIKRVDARRLGDLAGDEGVRIAAGDLSSNANLTAVLEDASETIVSACLVGGRYDRNALQAVVASAGKYRLYRLTADLALGYLVERRGYPQSEADRLAPGFNRALEDLEMLRQGNRILDVGTEDIPDAGLISPVPLSQAVTLPATVVCKLSKYFGTAATPNDGSSRGDCC